MSMLICLGSVVSHCLESSYICLASRAGPDLALSECFCVRKLW